MGNERVSHRVFVGTLDGRAAHEAVEPDARHHAVRYVARQRLSSRCAGLTQTSLPGRGAVVAHTEAGRSQLNRPASGVSR
jgi:hypothetical protein